MLSGRSWCHSGGGSLLVSGPRGGLTQRVVAAREWGFTIISRGGSFQFVPSGKGELVSRRERLTTDVGARRGVMMASCCEGWVEG